MDNKAHGMTVTEVRGFGRQYGQLGAGNADEDFGLPGNREPARLPKVRLDLVVLDDDADTMVDAIAKYARTETIGDGKIWVTTVDSALRVRTGERDRDAV
jgi:nitrogen regulatory protein P-II 1